MDFYLSVVYQLSFLFPTFFIVIKRYFIVKEILSNVKSMLFSSFMYIFILKIKS